MLIQSTAIPDVKTLNPKIFRDSRGFFVESFNAGRFADHGLPTDFKQDNLSYSEYKGTVRGLHFQRPPFAQHKLVSVLRGAILDVALDLRRSSPSYGRHVAVTLTAEKANQLLVPAAFAHGFCTLTPDTVVVYKVSEFYSAEHDDGIYWADPALGIDWPVSEAAAVLSDKDGKLPKLAEFCGCFE